MKRNTKKRTLGKMSNTRLTWQINPVTRVTKNKKRELNRGSTKASLKNKKWDY